MMFLEASQEKFQKMYAVRKAFLYHGTNARIACVRHVRVLPQGNITQYDCVILCETYLPANIYVFDNDANYTAYVFRANVCLF